MIAAYALWCGACWWLRGGKFGVIWRALFKREPGTTVTRIGCAILMAAPLAFVDPVYALVSVSIFAAMTIGYFGDSLEVRDTRETLLMAAWGIVALLTMLLPFAALAGSSWPLVPCAAGSLAAIAYRINKPLGRRLGLDWTERAELCTGAIFGSAIWLGV